MKANVNFTYEDSDSNLITEPTEGTIGRCRENGKAYVFKNGEWQGITGDVNLTTYQMNQMMYNQLTDLNEEELEDCKNTLCSYLESAPDSYYMLLCKDISYYTVFHLVAEGPKIADEIIECVKELGSIKEVDITKDGSAIEIWFADSEEAHAAYFFPYSKGVIECTL